MPQENLPRRALVIGGGIGGLATAIGLRRAGIEAHVFERRGELATAQFGSGLTIWSNAVRALDALGVSASVLTASSRLACFENRTSADTLLASWPIGEIGRELGWPSINLTREELHGALAGALDAGALHAAARCTGFEQDPTGVTAVFADGRRERGDLLVGADGLHSAIRAQLLGRSEPRYAGYVIWRAVIDCVDLEVAPERFTQLWGTGQRFGYYPLSRGRVYWWAVTNARLEETAPSDSRSTLRRRFAGWPEPVEALIERTAGESISRFPVYDRDPVKRWGTGPVTLLGDAAHPMTFNVGQGACQAIEDAVVLAAMVAHADDVPTGVRAYETARKDRTAPIMRLARRIGAVGAWERRAACAVRDRVLRLVLSGPAARQARRMMTPIV